MALIEGMHVQNYRALKDLSIGRTFENQGSKPLPRLMTFIGPNGSGKSSLMDALSFIGDCLQFGVEDACDLPHRGGFERLRTKGSKEPMKFEIYYRQEKNSRPISYSLHMDLGNDGRPFVAYERLRQRRKGQSRGQSYSFLEMTRGEGFAWAGEATEKEEGNKKIEVKLEDRQRLGITTLGNLADHPRIVAFRQFLESWYLSYFVPDLARGLPMTGAQKHLNRKGDNLANYVQFIERQHPKRFAQVLASISKKIPGIYKITHERQKDGRLLLQFNEHGYEDPFYQLDMSDGTLKMFAYLLLLEDPDPAPLIGIEEPENGLHHQLLEPLAVIMKQYAYNDRGGPQIVITTHSPYFVDALTPDEVWILEKGKDGFSTATLAADIPGIRELYSEGITMGSLWYSNHFGRGSLMFMEVLVEGGADVPAVREILERRFNLVEDIDFRIHSHRGKGKLPENIFSKPNSRNRGLLDQLPAKLRGFGKLPVPCCVVVLVDADDDNCRDLKSDLIEVYRKIDSKPSCVLFRIAVEETESWFIADSLAVKRAYPKVDLNKISKSPPDSIIGAWENLAKALGRKPEDCIGADKFEWARRISPYLDLNDPKSPSLRAFLLGLNDIVLKILQ